jgi:hypothetical protein
MSNCSGCGSCNDFSGQLVLLLFKCSTSSSSQPQKASRGIGAISGINNLLQVLSDLQTLLHQPPCFFLLYIRYLFFMFGDSFAQNSPHVSQYYYHLYKSILFYCLCPAQANTCTPRGICPCGLVPFPLTFCVNFLAST